MAQRVAILSRPVAGCGLVGRVGGARPRRLALATTMRTRCWAGALLEAQVFAHVGETVRWRSKALALPGPLSRSMTTIMSLAGADQKRGRNSSGVRLHSASALVARSLATGISSIKWPARATETIPLASSGGSFFDSSQSARKAPPLCQLDPERARETALR